MAASSLALTLGNISVRQLDGLFCLNDLHRAAGGEDRHQPAFFLRMDWARELRAEIENSANLQSFEKGADSHLSMKTIKGRNGGTYACRELVIAYAAWISAAFHLKVIRVFLDAATPKPQAPALAHARGPGMMFVTDAERRHLEVLRFTIYAGREAVYELARDVQKHHPWVDGRAAMPHNTARYVPGLSVQRCRF